MSIAFTLINTLKVLIPAVVSFFIGIAITPMFSDFLYKHKLWKKRARKLTTDGKKAEIFESLHKDKEVGTPRMGGVIIWSSVVVTTAVLIIIAALFPERATLGSLNFIDRGQTWLPFVTLIFGALVGLLDDYFEVSSRFDYFAGGLSLKKRLAAVTVIGLAGAWWFYQKLGFTDIFVPFAGILDLGIFLIPVFVVMMLGIHAGGVIDGIDGLAGGVFASIFSAYGIISFAGGQINLAAFCFAIVGGILAFLWFNIPPARFYMSETGSMALTITLTVVAFQTGHIIVLPLIALPLVVTAGSSTLQLLSKKIRGKKLFKIAPLHHYFEVIGWSREKITMRYWIISFICALLGVIIALLG